MDYIPKNVLLTGTAGFIGSAVSILLTKKYPNIYFVNLDKLGYSSDICNLDEIKDLKNFKFIHGNFCSSDLVNFILNEYNIDTIIHIGAYTHVGSSFGNSLEFTHNNVFGTHNLLECSRLYGKIKKFIHVSTDEVYDYFEDEHLPRDENHKLCGTSPYAATKSAAEMIVMSYYYSFKLPVIITRGNNVYGPRCYIEKIIPKFINQILRGKKLTIHGNGENKRNYLFVEDAARAFELILFKGEIGQTYNIGSKTELKNIELANIILDELKPGEDKKDFIEYTEDRNFNDQRYYINSQKLKNLGWEEQISWEEGIKITIDWYLKNSHKYNHLNDVLNAHEL